MKEDICRVLSLKKDPLQRPLCSGVDSDDALLDFP